MARKTAKALPPNMITVYAEIVQETEKAILVRCEEDADGVWLPKSQINYDGERGDMNVEIEIPELMATEKGFFDGMGYAPPAQPAPTEQPEGVKLTGSVMNYNAVESGTASTITFVVGSENEDEEYSETSYAIPIECVLDKELHDDSEDIITVTRAYAVEHGLIPPPEADAIQPEKRAFGDNVKWIKEESITVSQPLSDAEKARYAEEMAALDKEIEELEDERDAVSSRLKKQIDAKEQERREMSAHVNDGELRTYSCDLLKDYNTGEMVWTAAYPPYEEVRRRKMTKEEMQPTLLEYSEKMAASATAEDGEEQRKTLPPHGTPCPAP